MSSNGLFKTMKNCAICQKKKECTLMPQDVSQEFYALVSGKVPSPFDETFPEIFCRDHLTLRVASLGEVNVPSGLLEVCDPFIVFS